MEYARLLIETGDKQRSGDEHEFSSPEAFSRFLGKYRYEKEEMHEREKSSDSVFDDGNVLGTSKQFAFTLGERSAQDSILAGFAHTVVDYFSEGVFTLVVMSLLKYIWVAILHVLFYEFIPDLGMFVQEIDWDTAFLLLNFVVGFIIQGEIRSSVSRFTQHPRVAFGFYRYLIHTSQDLCQIHQAYKKYGGGNNTDDDERVVEKREEDHLFIGVFLDLVRLTKMVVAFFQEMETKGSRKIQDQYEAHVSSLFGKLAALRMKGIISAELEIYYRTGIRDSMESMLSQAGFNKRFVPNTLVDNHLKLVILIYLWIFVPVQLYASTGFMVVFIYPLMMLMFDMVQVLDKLQGQPFSYQGGQHHPNDYRTWEKDALDAIYGSCLLANVDRM